jgi:hypothetical protein
MKTALIEYTVRQNLPKLGQCGICFLLQYATSVGVNTPQADTGFMIAVTHFSKTKKQPTSVLIGCFFL